MCLGEVPSIADVAGGSFRRRGSSRCPFARCSTPIVALQQGMAEAEARPFERARRNVFVIQPPLLDATA
jgi:hypothetical protein